MTDEPQLEIVRNEEKSRYEVVVDGTVAGLTEFEVDDAGRVVFPHTEVDPAFGGRGLGSILVAGAMADEAARGETVVPVCPFVVKYLQKNDVPGLDIHWRPRDVETAAHATADEKQPSDEGVGSSPA